MIAKTTKRLSAAALAAVLILFSSLTAFAETTKNHSLTDDADVFTGEQTVTLEKMMETVGMTTGWQIIIYTSEFGIPADSMENYYNVNVHDKGNYEKSNVMLVIDMKSGKRIILTHGDAMYYFSDSRMDQIKSKMKPYLERDDMYGASMEFVNTVLYYYDSGKPEGGEFSNLALNEKHDNPFLYSLKRTWFIGLLLGAAAALVFFFVNKSRYKNTGKSNTYDLHSNSGLKLLSKNDEFLHKSVTYTVESTSSSGGSSGGGGGGGGSSHGSSGAF